MNYENFLSRKLQLVKPVGFEIHEPDIHPALFDFQRAAIKGAIELKKSYFESAARNLNTAIELRSKQQSPLFAQMEAS